MVPAFGRASGERRSGIDDGTIQLVVVGCAGVDRVADSERDARSKAQSSRAQNRRKNRRATAANDTFISKSWIIYKGRGIGGLHCLLVSVSVSRMIVVAVGIDRRRGSLMPICRWWTCGRCHEHKFHDGWSRWSVS